MHMHIVYTNKKYIAYTYMSIDTHTNTLTHDIVCTGNMHVHVHKLHTHTHMVWYMTFQLLLYVHVHWCTPW